MLGQPLHRASDVLHYKLPGMQQASYAHSAHCFWKSGVRPCRQPASTQVVSTAESQLCSVQPHKPTCTSISRMQHLPVAATACTAAREVP